jgi:S1-C subfamily serine protease
LRREAAHASTRRQQAPEAKRGRAVAIMSWLCGMLAILLALQFFLPRIVEQTQYAAARGRQRAEHEAALDGLKNMPLSELSRAYQMVSQRVGPSVVHINVTGPDEPAVTDESSHFFGPNRREAHGQGSGVIIDKAGYVLTNYHVVRGSSDIKVGLSDGRLVKGQVIGVDAPTDLAVLRVKTDNLIAAEWGDSDDLHVGALVWAVGSPFGLQRSITSGILSAKNRAGMGSVYQDFLQTDAAVNPGNSGGPLVDENGRVIGINTAIVGQTYQGISFAIPSSIAREVYQRLKTEGHFARGWLGIALDSVSEERAKQLGLTEAKGAYVQQVVEDQGGISPAKQAGLKAGDVVVTWNGKQIDSPTTLSRVVAQTQIGSTVKVVIVRAGQEQTLDVTVGLRPQQLN